MSDLERGGASDLLLNNFNRQCLLAGNDKLGRRDFQFADNCLDGGLDASGGSVIVERRQNRRRKIGHFVCSDYRTAAGAECLGVKPIRKFYPVDGFY